MNSYILSIDAGTTGITIYLIQEDGKTLNKYYSEFKQYFPKPGWVEHDAEEIWLVTLNLIQTAFLDFSPKYCNAIGITNQRETTVIWNKNNHKPIYKAIVWQCRRTQNYCNKLIKSNYNDLINEKTGLVIDSYFSSTKIQWILDNVPNGQNDAKQGKLAFGTIDTWILWKLTNGKSHLTDYTNASRTMLFNINTMQWDNELLNIFQIPKAILPKVRKSNDLFGKTNKNIFGKSIPITAIIGDQQAALYGQGCFNKGEIKCTYGTGSFILVNTGQDRINSSSNLLTTIACDKKGLPIYAIEGSIFTGGALIQWLRDELNLISTADETEKIALSILDTNGVSIVPAFTGLGAPHWNMKATGTIIGLTRGSNKKHIIRACLESIAFQVYDLMRSISNDFKYKINTINVDGGASNNNFLMQFQSNIMNLNINRKKNIESTALGACLLAGIGSGLWNNPDEVDCINNNQKQFTPKINQKERNELLLKWEKAIKTTLYSASL